MNEHKSPERQLLRDPNIQPTSENLAEIPGEQYGVYEEFISMLGDFDVEVQWRYYNDGKAWLAKGLYKWKTTRGTDKEKTIFWLSVWDGFFKVSFYFAEKAREGLLSLPLGEITKSKMEEAKPMGKLKFFPIVFEVRKDNDLEDLCALIDYQKSIK